jgi:hypothetical protein
VVAVNKAISKPSRTTKKSLKTKINQKYFVEVFDDF